MIADGCGFNHVDAASYYQYGNTGAQRYEQFPVTLSMKTDSRQYTGPVGHWLARGYDPDQAWHDFYYHTQQPTDSAAAATAMSTGVKTYDAAIGVDVDRRPLTHLMEYAAALGKATGIVTSVQITHATPAGFVAHAENRNNYRLIAEQMLRHSALTVLMGCGHPWYDDDGRLRADPVYTYVGDEQLWGMVTTGSIAGDKSKDAMPHPWTFIDDRQEFQRLAHAGHPQRVLGIAKVYTTLQQARSEDTQAPPYGVALTQTVPTLAEMSQAALNVLAQNNSGFILMIEGGAIDWAAHANQSGRMIEELIDFNQAVETVLAWIERNSSWQQTLLIVTSDHETGYLTGPGSGIHNGIPQWTAIVNNGRGAVPGMQWNSREHTNSLVPLYAKGAGAHLFSEASWHRLPDPYYDAYIDNTDIGTLCIGLLP